MGPALAEGWGTGEGFAIHPAREVGRGDGAGWNGFKSAYPKSDIQKLKYKSTKLDIQKLEVLTNQIQIASDNSMLVKLTPWALRGGNPPALGTAPISGLVTGDGALAPFGCPQVWSTNRVFMSGLAFGFLQSWCCQFKLSNTKWIISGKGKTNNHE